MRSQLATYAQVGGNILENTRQARKWLKEVDANLAGPMARGSDGKDYYVHELALVYLDGVERPVMITRWYERDGVVVADVHPMRLSPGCDAFVIDGRDDKIEIIPLHAFMLSIEQLSEPSIQAKYGLPPPDRVLGM